MTEKSYSAKTCLATSQPMRGFQGELQPMRDICNSRVRVWVRPAYASKCTCSAVLGATAYSVHVIKWVVVVVAEREGGVG